MKQTRSQYSQDYLIEEIRERFRENITHSIKNKELEQSTLDCLMSGLAIFVFKHPSLLDFEKAYKESSLLRENLKRLFGCSWIPCDTQMRVRLDEVNPSLLNDAFKGLFRILQRGKTLEEFVFYQSSYLVSVDGTGYYSSGNVSCENCCIKEHKNGDKTYYHQALMASLVHPDQKVVFPFLPQMIQKQDGSTKNDCERNSMKRWVEHFKRDHPHLNITIVGDGLYANAPLINLLTEKKMSYILVAQEGDHSYLFDWFKMGTFPEKNTLTQTDSKKTLRTYEWMNDVPLNDSSSVRVNVLSLTETKPNQKPTKWVWTTNYTISEKNAALLARGGRARWRIENETFNTLKNQGYNLEHNYGHGKKNLSSIFVHLVLLAFFMDQVLQKVNKLVQTVLARFGSKRALWEQLRVLIYHIPIVSFEAFYSLLSKPPDGSLVSS